MKCFIKTAHGYLSFQPPLGGTPNGQATMQYRESAGAWEELDITAWDYETVPAPPDGGTTPPEPVYEVPGGIPPSETAEYVGQIKNYLLGQGENLSGPCGAFLIVANVAWGCQTLNTGIGLLSKPDGNQCMSYSTDVVCYKDYPNGSARIVDILSDAGGLNTPSWQEKGAEENVAMDRWRPPIEPATVQRTTMRRHR